MASAEAFDLERDIVGLAVRQAVGGVVGRRGRPGLTPAMLTWALIEVIDDESPAGGVVNWYWTTGVGSAWPELYWRSMPMFWPCDW